MSNDSFSLRITEHKRSHRKQYTAHSILQKNGHRALRLLWLAVNSGTTAGIIPIDNLTIGTLACPRKRPNPTSAGTRIGFLSQAKWGCLRGF